MTDMARSQSAKRGIWRALRRGDRGTTLVEFALTIFTYLLVVMGVMEVALMVYTYAVISAAAKEGVRYAAVVGLNPNTVLANNTWTLNEVPGGCPFGTAPFGTNGDPTVGIQCKVYDYARYSLQSIWGRAVSKDGTCVNSTKFCVYVNFPSLGAANDPYCGTPAQPWSAPCTVRVSVTYNYAPLFGIPLTPTMSAVAEGRIMN
jgi:TadE-like protein